jgi:hypothetical protein
MIDRRTIGVALGASVRNRVVKVGEWEHVVVGSHGGSTEYGYDSQRSKTAQSAAE